jgi:hypothetical protein
MDKYDELWKNIDSESHEHSQKSLPGVTLSTIIPTWTGLDIELRPL